MNFRASLRSLRVIFRTARSSAATIPRWALPFYWCTAACVLLFGGFVWLVASFCLSMRPLYESSR